VRGLSAAIDRVLLWLSTGKHVDGLWMGCDSQDNAEEALRRVERALQIIKVHDPRRHDRIIRDLDRVWVRLVPGYLAEFNSKLRACVLDERFVLAETTQPEEIAVVIVHEATHARLENLGIGYDDGQRDRVEAICVRRELAFAKRLPNGHPKRERVEATLDAQAEFWSNTAFRQRDTEGRAQTLRYLGTPNWIVRVLLAISGRRTS
jgi:hypothetical protein